MSTTHGWVPDGICTVFVCDISSFGNPARTDNIKRYVRAALYSKLRISFDAAKVPFINCYREDRGDGVLVAVPPGFAVEILLTTLSDHLRSEIRRHNEVSSTPAQMRLRVAVHTGAVHTDDFGLVGKVVDHTFRILEAEPFKNALARSSANLGLIVSQRVYEDVIRPGLGLVDPTDYRQIAVKVKETMTNAWINLPGDASVAVSAPTTVPDPSVTIPPQPTMPDSRYVYEDLFDVIDCMLAIPKMMTEQGRGQVIGALPPDLAAVISRSQEPRSDTYEIVRTCLDYPGGLQQLLHALRGFVGESLAMREVERAVARLILGN